MNGIDPRTRGEGIVRSDGAEHIRNGFEKGRGMGAQPRRLRRLCIRNNGHMLEWLSLYVEPAILESDWVVRGVHALCRAVEQEALRTQSLADLSHAERALKTYLRRVSADDPARR